MITNQDISKFGPFQISNHNFQLKKNLFKTGIHAALALMLHCHYLKESLHVNFSRKALQYIGDFGIVGFVSGAALTLFYIFLEIYYRAGEFYVGYLFSK